MIGVFIGLRLGILGWTTAFTFGWGIRAFVLSLSLCVCGKVNREMMNDDEKTKRER